MNREFFKNQIERLSRAFSSSIYSNERVSLIWQEVNNFSDDWMRKVTDKFIGELRSAPLITEFRQECSEERERLRLLDKKKEEREAKDFINGTAFRGSDVQVIVKMILDRMGNKIDDATWESCLLDLKKAAIHNKPKCLRCDDSGIAFIQDNKKSHAAKCSCSRGRALELSLYQLRY